MFKSIAKISIIILLLILISVVILIWQSTYFTNKAKDILNSELDGIAKIEYSELTGNLFETINISDLEITLADSSTIKANSIKLEYNITSVIFQPYLIREFQIDSIAVNFKEKNMQVFGSSDNVLNTNVTTENKVVKTGRTKALGVVLNTTATGGDFHLKDGGASGTVKFKYKTSGTTSGGNPIVIMFPGPIQFKSDLCVAFTTEHVTVCSVFYT